ncbi:hypothetical protein [Paraburkholderia heleia]|uniref:hypothetical protein n=1 Tax=Paraburkholderia heleia TaxID=634127 RepID=UPI0031CF7ACE
MSLQAVRRPLKDDLIQYIASRTPVLFFQRVVEEIEAAHFAAHQHAGTFEAPERFRVQPQLTHYRSNEALRKAASDAGLVVAAPHTEPKGERFSLVASGEIRFGQICVPFDNRIPRPAKHRKAIAAVNGRLEPAHADLFSGVTEPLPDGLGCLIVAVKAHKSEPQSVPFGVMVGVPYSSLADWHVFVPVSEVMAAYHPEEKIEVPDLAFATLKRRMGESEK